MKSLALACLAAVALTGVAHATPGCVALTDPAGDQTLLTSSSGSPAVAVPAPDALDVLGVAASATPDAVSATFTLSAPASPLPGTQYTYSLAFSDADHDYRLEAVVSGVQLPVGQQYQLLARSGGTSVGSDGGAANESAWARFPATGSVDLAAHTVTVTAPATSFGVTTLAGDSWTVSRANSNAGALSSSVGSIDEVLGNGAVLTAQDAGTC